MLQSIKARVWRAIYRARYFPMRMRYGFVNPECRSWDVYPPSKMARALDFVLARAGVRYPLETAIDHGCGRGHYREVLRRYAKKLIGVDIFPTSPGYDRYFQVKAGLPPEIHDASVDLVFVISSIGMHPDGKHDDKPHCSDWVDYFTGPKRRQAEYFLPQHYPRVLRPGGYLVIQEWEAWPEQRFGTITRAEVERRIDEFYPHADIPGFSMIVKGISPQLIGPYIVYRKQ